MNPTLQKLTPYLLILLGLIILFMTKLSIVAGVCLLIGIVMFFEQIWPEKWGADIHKSNID